MGRTIQNRLLSAYTRVDRALASITSAERYAIFVVLHRRASQQKVNVFGGFALRAHVSLPADDRDQLLVAVLLLISLICCLGTRTKPALREG